LAIEGSLTVDLFAIHLRGTDAFGRPFEIALEAEDASKLIFKLHRMILEQEQMRRQVNKAHDGGKVA
jgi:hypothetical protein